MRIAVIGSGGQLGSELCRLLGPEATGLDLPELDLTDRAEVVSRLVELEPEVIVNAAAYTRVDQAEAEPEAAAAVNARAVECLADVCRALSATLVQVSTDYVFGGEPGRDRPYRETDSPAPLGVYGRTKLQGERLAADWTRHLIVRTCGLYGRGGPRASGSFVETMLRLARRGEPIRVVGDQHCTPTYVPHLARAIQYLAGSTAWGTYHVVNRGATTWYEFARELFRLAGLEVDPRRVTTAEYPTAARRPLYSVLDPSKYHALPGAPAMPDWKEALAQWAGGEGRGAGK